MAKEHDPYLKFYPADWFSDMSLQSCSLELQGLWINLVCYMHKDGNPYGHLARNGEPLSIKEIAFLLRFSDEKRLEILLKQLVEANVCSATNKGMIYSRRLLRDMKLRDVKSKAGKAGYVAKKKKVLLEQSDQAKRGNGNGNGNGNGSVVEEMSESKPSLPRDGAEIVPVDPTLPEGKSVEKKSAAEPTEWAVEIRDDWNDWRQGAGLNADPTASPNGQGVKNLLALAKAEKIEPDRLALCAERYLSTVADPQFICHFANFWGRQRRFEACRADDWTPVEQSRASPRNGGGDRYQFLNSKEMVYD